MMDITAKIKPCSSYVLIQIFAKSQSNIIAIMKMANDGKKKKLNI
jgi:hypothetical protein